MNSHRLPGKGKRTGRIMEHTMHYRRIIITLQRGYSIFLVEKKNIYIYSMVIHLYKTSNPSTRNGTIARNNLTYGKHRCGKGRNVGGIITAGRRGGGHKHLYRKIDFRRNEKNIYGKIITREYDPNRNASICLIHYGDGEKRYILHVKGTEIGNTIRV
ncbi:hypothetical protein RHGRI_020396 [Rhododendron griersonianum]|uniref:Large ribosomal subunit protein uL2 RNA-binding domain-containing protein n=1 Tax=Rhododendron griersonianum TaxID=479676 RepID=A0AAV6JJI7_9ERIC|nr:hypothetical protein RHGRI_020396 [Rhododendron griersonianum]